MITIHTAPFVPAAEAYGERRHEMLGQEVPRKIFRDVDNIELAMHIASQFELRVHSIKATKVGGDTIIVDGNHPLAG